MSLINEIPEIIEHVKRHQEETEFNFKMFDILEGNLVKYVEESLQEQLSHDSFVTAMERVAPVNIFRKVVNKLSTLYTDDPVRVTEIDSDQELVNMYTEELGINLFMEDLNKGYNSYKWSTIEVYNDNGVKVRVIPSHQFLPYSNNPKNPIEVTAMIKFMGSFKDHQGNTRNKFHVTSADEFISIDDKGNLIESDMVATQGVNPHGVIPFTFVSKSRHLLVPMPDRDDFRMVVLIPVLLTDLNFAVKFLAHGIVYGIDIDSDNLKLSPDAFWSLKSNDEGKNPQVGTIQPGINITDTLTLSKAELALWLDTKSIKAGSVGKADGDASASGIAKIIDEGDTTIERKAQAKFFKKVELEFWRTLAKIHNDLVASREITGVKTFSDPKKLKVVVSYAEQRPLMSRKERIEELKLETDAGFKSIKRAIKELNPHEDEVLILEEINDEGMLVVKELDLKNDQGKQEV